MSMEVTKKKVWKGMVEDLKRYNLLWITAMLVVLGAVFFVLFVVCTELSIGCLSLMSFGMAMFNCYYSTTKYIISMQMELVANYKDRVALLGAENRNLRQELEALTKPGTPVVETPPAEGQKQEPAKPKRKPAFKRKPKTGTKDETQN